MIQTLKLKNFRRFINHELKFTKNLVIIIGKNAVGKTSILEAINIITTSKSYRALDFREVINKDKLYSHIILDENKKYEIILSQKGKKAIINQLEYKKISDYVGNFKTVLFSPNDLFLINGTKSERRNFLDLEISLLDKLYLEEINNYRKLIKQRNNILKVYNETQKVILNVITEQLIEKAYFIINKRKEFIKLLNNKIKNIHLNLIDNELIELEYLPNVSIEKLKNIYNEKLNYDILTKMTNYGPHRDDFKILINGFMANSYASQGQMRGIAISLKISLLEIIKEKTNKDIVLLLDDVFSELDNKRQNKLVSYLLNQHQTIITTNNIYSLPKELCQQAQIIEIKES